MTDSFEELYDQIIQCEQRVEDRQRQLVELRDDVQNCKDTIQQAAKEQSHLQNELLSRVEQFGEVRLNQTNLETREAILASHKQMLLDENGSMKNDLTRLLEKVEAGMVEFCESVDGRSDDLDLTMSGQRARQNKAADILAQLQADQAALVQEMAHYESGKEKISQLEAERYCLQQNLCDLMHSKQELEECCFEEGKKLEEVEEERQNAAKTPSCNDELNGLQEELAALSTDALEEECSNLQLQLNTLQQQLRKKQQQLLRQQQLPRSLQRADVPPSAGPPRAASRRVAAPDPAAAAASGGTCPTVGGAQGRDADGPGKTVPATKDFFDDELTLPDLDLPEQDEGEKLFKVCNRLKPVFKPMQC